LRLRLLLPHLHGYGGYFLFSVQAFMNPVDMCFKSIQGLTTVVSEHYVMLRNFVTNLKLLLEVEGLLSTEDVTTLSADVQRVTTGPYSATRASIRNFVAGLVQFSVIRWRAVPDNSKPELKDGIGMLFLSAFEIISSMVA
jgi:hypothetical protein